MVLSRCSLRSTIPLLRSPLCVHSMMQSRMLTAQEKFRMRYLRLKQAKALRVPCHMAARRSEYKCGKLSQMSCHVDHAVDPCGLHHLPLDLEHYRPSDKEARCYQRTWCESYPLPRPVKLPYEKIYPKRKRRNPKAIKSKHITACNPDEIEEKPRSRAPVEHLINIPGRQGPMACCKMVIPGCKPARKEPVCALHLGPICCEKRTTKYPSFSECRKHDLGPPIPICECNKKLSVCEMWTYFRNKRS